MLIMKESIKKDIDKDLKLFLDVVNTLRKNIELERTRLYKNNYPSEYIVKYIHFYRKNINKLIKRLRIRLKITSIEGFLYPIK